MTMIARNLFFRITKPDGTTHVDQARVWDAERYITMLTEIDAYKDCKAEAITREQYLAERNSN